MLKRQQVITAILSAGLLLFTSPAVAHDVMNMEGTFCHYHLTSSDVGTALVTIEAPDPGSAVTLTVTIAAHPNTLYTVWIDFKSRETGLLADDYPSCHGTPRNPMCGDPLNPDPELNKGALPRGVAPAFASTDPVFDGMRVDLNGIVTDMYGKATLAVILDYNPLEDGESPVVGTELAMQGPNRVGGYWLRVYDEGPYTGDPNTGELVPTVASLQETDGDVPELERATPKGITIVGHNDFITHGHTPGVGGVRGGPGDHFPGFKGDFPAECVDS